MLRTWQSFEPLRKKSKTQAQFLSSRSSTISVSLGEKKARRVAQVRSPHALLPANLFRQDSRTPVGICFRQKPFRSNDHHLSRRAFLWSDAADDRRRAEARRHGSRRHRC